DNWCLVTDSGTCAEFMGSLEAAVDQLVGLIRWQLLVAGDPLGEAPPPRLVRDPSLALPYDVRRAVLRQLAELSPEASIELASAPLPVDLYGPGDNYTWAQPRGRAGASYAVSLRQSRVDWLGSVFPHEFRRLQLALLYPLREWLIKGRDEVTIRSINPWSG